MFKRFLILVLTLGLVGIGTAGARDRIAVEDEHILPTGGDGWSPWPWSLSAPFPWSDISGSWRVEHGDFISYFSLRVVNSKASKIPQLVIHQYDGETCRLLSRGVGIEGNNKIYAQMTSLGGTVYRVHYTAFNPKDSPQTPLRGNFPIADVMVVSMGLLDETTPEQMSHMQIVKVSQSLTQYGCLADLADRK